MKKYWLYIKSHCDEASDLEEFVYAKTKQDAIEKFKAKHIGFSVFGNADDMINENSVQED